MKALIICDRCQAEWRRPPKSQRENRIGEEWGTITLAGFGAAQ